MSIQSIDLQRDLSLAVPVQRTAEEIGDRVRALLSARGGCLQAVTILSETSYLQLSTAARRRLGMTPQQKNVLLRLVIHDPEHTLTSTRANELRDEVYAALHEGAVKIWAAREAL